MQFLIYFHILYSYDFEIKIQSTESDLENNKNYYQKTPSKKTGDQFIKYFQLILDNFRKLA